MDSYSNQKGTALYFRIELVSSLCRRSVKLPWNTINLDIVKISTKCKKISG